MERQRPAHWHFNMVSSHFPPCVTIAINAAQRRKTLAAMLQSKAFVLGIPGIDQVKEADYLGIESGYNSECFGKIISIFELLK